MSNTDSSAEAQEPRLEIKSVTGRVMFVSRSTSVKGALEEAVKAKADLRSADLRSADLSFADLSFADLRFADLRFADLSFADLSCANLRYANLSYANLSSANLSSANLSSADLILSVAGLPSGHAIFMPTPDGWALRVGCWTGTVGGLREMIAKDHGWPEATGQLIVQRRPMLAALADMCDAWAVTRQADLDAIVAKWASKTDTTDAVVANA